MSTIQEAKKALNKYFGYSHFRKNQEKIIQSVLDKKDTVVLMPTGGGKSICFQIPALVMPGMTVVVSPLISLMKDQVESLLVNGIPAAYLNSSQSFTEQDDIEIAVGKGEIQLLYVSPEKMLSPTFFNLLEQSNINLFAIDEAHCISSWGHDFRPEYTQMSFLKKSFPDIPIIALTATADKLTRKDISSQLGMVKPKVFISSFDRPNLSLSVKPGQKRFEQILDFIGPRKDMAGIIYCLSRKSTESLARKLWEKGHDAQFYHAGMRPEERNRVQEDFINDRIPIVCATIAFGMGIDKSNVRWVIHYNLPKNLEGYYQEIGRAGRDGAKSDTLLFYSYSDVSLLRDIIQRNHSQLEDIQLLKLERMKQYAEALICRRKILLNYFSETLKEDCGNCDICRNPPQMFDGTELAQKALSAVVRTREKVGINLLIDILRGSKKKEVLSRGFDKIKTYGIGGDISANDWQYLIQQMINLGIVEIAYDQHHVLKITDEGKEVLFGHKSISLAKMTEVRSRRMTQKEKRADKKREFARNDLFKTLRQLRKDLARQAGIPPYIVFNDASLEEMAAVKPANEAEFRAINGVGEVKLQKYGPIFLRAIAKFQGDNTSKDGSSSNHLRPELRQVLQLYKRSLPLIEIAMLMNKKPAEITKLLAELYQKNQPVKLSSFISRKELKTALEAAETIPGNLNYSSLKKTVDDSLSDSKIRFALAYIKKNG